MKSILLAAIAGLLAALPFAPTARPVSPVDLARSSTAPAGPAAGRRPCAPGAICVGPGLAYPGLAPALAVARPGDVIEIVGGTYRESDVIDVPELTIRGVAGRAHFDCTGLELADRKSCLFLAADGITLDNLEISGAVLPDEAGGNGACIRNARGVSFTLRRISCHASQEGLLTNGGRVVIDGSEFYDNGWNAITHNVYFSGNCIAVIVRGSIFRDARVGHEFKSRCPINEISYSYFRSTRGSRDLDLSDGGQTLVYRSTLVKTSGAENDEIVGFAPESCAHPGRLVLRDVTVINADPNAAIHNFGKCRGEPIVFEGVRFEGLPVREIGYIVRR
jgi:Right handed beta helix region